MKLKIGLRHISIALLHFAVKIAPQHAAEWGRAMLGELHHVEGDWAAFMWAVGGAGMLTKRALFSLLIPGQSDPIAPSEGKFFAKENAMRKSTLIAAAVCLAACLLFFAAPSFRQGFEISMAQGGSLISTLRGHSDHGDSRPGFVRKAGHAFTQVVDQARKNHDAEGLAFAAVHHWGAPESAGLADEAVRMDPNLTWIYTFVVGRKWSVPCSTSFLPLPDEEWVSKLEQFDPQNALAHLMLAQRIRILDGKCLPGGEASNPAWLSAMAVAFASSKLDTYDDRIEELNHKVTLRYGLGPYEAANLGGPFWVLDPSEIGTPNDYAKLLLDSGDTLAARGDDRGAVKKYLLAAHFGEMMQPREQRSLDTLVRGIYASEFLESPYRHLATLYAKHGDKEQALFFADLAARAEQARHDFPTLAEQFWRDGIDDGARDAQILEVSGIAMFFSIGLILFCVVVKIARSGSIQLSKLHAGRLTTMLGCGGVIGLLCSSITLYLSYRPYAESVRAYLRDGDPIHLMALGGFFNYLDSAKYFSLPNYLFYFWAGIIVLCVVALVFMGIRLIAQHRRPAMAA
jgi:hypothetical protein